VEWGQGKRGEEMLGTEKESKKVKMSDTPEPSDSAFSAIDCQP